jgi:hypothetical protein
MLIPQSPLVITIYGKNPMFTLTDHYDTTLTIAKTSEGGLDLQIKGGQFNRNQTILNAQESDEFPSGLKGGEYNLSRALPEGGLEFVTVMGYSNVDTKSRDYQMLIGSSTAGILNLGSFFLDSLDEGIAGVAGLLED